MHELSLLLDSAKPDIIIGCETWLKPEIHSNHTKKLNRSFLDTFKDCLLEQIVNFPTRKNKTLDLFITNKPSLVSKCKPLPGLSGHDIVMTDNKIMHTTKTYQKDNIFVEKRRHCQHENRHQHLKF